VQHAEDTHPGAAAKATYERRASESGDLFVIGQSGSRIYPHRSIRRGKCMGRLLSARSASVGALYAQGNSRPLHHAHHRLPGTTAVLSPMFVDLGRCLAGEQVGAVDDRHLVELRDEANYILGDRAAGTEKRSGPA